MQAVMNKKSNFQNLQTDQTMASKQKQSPVKENNAVKKMKIPEGYRLVKEELGEKEVETLIDAYWKILPRSYQDKMVEFELCGLKFWESMNVSPWDSPAETAQFFSDFVWPKLKANHIFRVEKLNKEIAGIPGVDKTLTFGKYKGNSYMTCWLQINPENNKREMRNYLIWLLKGGNMKESHAEIVYQCLRTEIQHIRDTLAECD